MKAWLLWVNWREWICGKWFFPISLSLHTRSIEATKKKSKKEKNNQGTSCFSGQKCSKMRPKPVLSVASSLKCCSLSHVHAVMKVGTVYQEVSSLSLPFRRSTRERWPHCFLHKSCIFILSPSFSLISSSVSHCLSLPLFLTPLYPSVSVSRSSPNFLSISFLCVNSLKSIMHHTDSLISWIK